MAKRGAQSDLNRDNWDEDEGGEEAGTFTIASEEDLNKRKIIKARRRIPSENKKSGGVFKNFTGFSGFTGLNSTSTNNSSAEPELKPAAKASLSSFSGFSGLNSKSDADSSVVPELKPAIKTSFAGFTNDSTTAELKPDANTSLSGFTGFAGLSSTTSKNSWSSNEKPWTNGNGNNDETRHEAAVNDEVSDTYLESIKALNMSVSSWIQKHLKDNPFVDLTPVFNDYRKHLANIDHKVTPSKQSPDVKPLPLVTPPSSLSKNEQISSKSLNFQTSEAKQEPNKEKLFAGLAAASAMTEKPKETMEDEPSDEPPKPKSVVTAEEGSKFSVRCKLFFNRNNAWSELGVGMLNIKDIDGKSQLLVRADTATGKILVNVFINSTTPVTRSGKNNVMLVSIPNPPLYSKPSEGDNSKPATYLIRVKTGDIADELFQLVEEIRSE